MEQMMRDFDAESFFVSTCPDHGLENVLASYVRRQEMSLKDIQRRWDLTEGKARGVMYATCGRAVIRDILRHPNGGWDMGLMLLTGVIGHDLQTHVTETKRMRDAQRRDEEVRDQRLLEMARDLRSVADLAVGGRA